jgi:FkbH-like protein/thioester reductase-like protein
MKSKKKNNQVLLSDDQKRLWQIESFTKQDYENNIPFYFQLEGKLDIQILEDSIKLLISRHEILRTSYKAKNKSLQGEIHDSINWHLEVEDFSSFQLKEKNDNIQKRLSEIASIKFKFDGNPLFKSFLLVKGENQFVLAFVFFHFIFDAMSIVKFIKELSFIYNKKKNNLLPTLPPLPKQFKDYVEMENKVLKRKCLKKLKERWKAPLRDKVFQRIHWSQHEVDSKASKVSQHEFIIDEDLIFHIMEKAKQLKVNPYFIYLAAFSLSIHLTTYTENFVINTAKLLTTKREFVNLIGFLTAPMCTPISITHDQLIDEFIKNVEAMWNEQRQCHLNYSEETALIPGENKRYKVNQVFFSYINYPLHELDLNDVSSEFKPLKRENLDFEFFLTLNKSHDNVRGYVEWLTEAIDNNVAIQICDRFISLLDVICKNKVQKTTDTYKILNISFPSQIHLLSSFSLEPIFPVMDFWSKRLPTSFRYTVGGSNQIIQNLLDQSSSVNNNAQDLIAIMFRWEDAFRYIADDKMQSEHHLIEKVIAYSKQFIHALKVFTSSTGATLFIISCPPSEKVLGQNKLLQVIELENEKLKKLSEELQPLYFEPSHNLLSLYPIKKLYDERRDELAHIPYSNSFFVALGTRIARFFFRYHNPSYKVAILDCDNTLWSGEVGDIGEKNIVIREEHRNFQRHLLDLKNNGIVLCLASKNKEEDVWKVFDDRNDMVIKKDDILLAKINWNSKSNNIKEIAQYLNLGMESFVFFDDSPSECGDVSYHLKTPTVWKIPNEVKLLNGYIESIWGLDKLKASDIDKARTLLYKQEVQRKELESIQDNYLEFLKHLNLVVEYKNVQEEDIPRASQLTLRTNQFTNGSMRRKEQDIRKLINDENYVVTLVKVEDRYGSYGDVGLIIFTQNNESIYIDTFILSCRIIGRGVEFNMMKHIANNAHNNSQSKLHVSFNKTKKNLPIQNFFDSLHSFVPKSFKSDDFYQYDVSAFKDLSLNAFIKWKEEKVSVKDQSSSLKSIPSLNHPIKRYNSTFQKWVMDNAYSVNSIADLACIDIEISDITEVDVNDLNKTLDLVATIFCKILQSESVDHEADFFDDLGGSSLDFVELLVKIDETFQCSLSYDEVLEKPTINYISYILTKKFTQTSGEEVQEVIAKKYHEDFNKELSISLPLIKATKEQEVLLTGATGNLGSYLLRELLLTTKKTIHCLVRSSEGESPEERIGKVLNKIKLNDKNYENRVIVYEGDLSLEKFGMSDKDYQILSETVDVIYHNAAQVNFIMPYSKLRKANVDSMIHIIDFALTTKQKHIHYVSSNVVFDTLEKNCDMIIEEAPLDISRKTILYGGYAQTKWINEVYLEKAKKKGLSCTIYRPAGIFAAEDSTSHLVPDDILTVFITSSFDIGAVPDINTHVNAAPVDYVARTLVYLSLQDEAKGKVFHLSHPFSIVLQHYVHLCSELGFFIERLPYEEWIEKLKHNIEKSTVNSQLKTLYTPIFVSKTPENPEMSWMQQALERGYLDTSKTLSFFQDKLKLCEFFDYKNILRQILLSFSHIEEVSSKNRIKQKSLSNCTQNNQNIEKKILILYANVGDGHKAKALFFEKNLASIIPQNSKVILVSLDSISLLEEKISSLYNFININQPHLYKYYHELANEIIEDNYNAFADHLERMATDIMDEYNPYMIISVVSVASCLAPYIKKINPQLPFITYVTDWMGNCLKGWATPEADIIYCNTERCKNYLVSCGAKPDQLHVIEPNLDDQIYNKQSEQEREDLCSELGLLRENPTLLYNTTGKPHYINLIKHLESLNININVIVLCYNNRDIFNYCNSINSKYVRIFPLLWSDSISELIKFADIIISKAGPGTLQQAYAAETQCLINLSDGILPQEVEIIDFFKENKIGETFDSEENYLERLQQMLLSVKNHNPYENLPKWKNNNVNFFNKLIKFLK